MIGGIKADDCSCGGEVEEERGDGSRLETEGVRERREREREREQQRSREHDRKTIRKKQRVNRSCVSLDHGWMRDGDD
jgi:hypothetical protein